jgi:hypothetical protein
MPLNVGRKGPTNRQTHKRRQATWVICNVHFPVCRVRAAGQAEKSKRGTEEGQTVFLETLESVHLLEGNGCPGWDRTSDQVINSHLLCH